MRKPRSREPASRSFESSDSMAALVVQFLLQLRMPSQCAREQRVRASRIASDGSARPTSTRSPDALRPVHAWRRSWYPEGTRASPWPDRSPRSLRKAISAARRRPAKGARRCRAATTSLLSQTTSLRPVSTATSASILTWKRSKKIFAPERGT